MSQDAVQDLLAKHAAEAGKKCGPLRGRRVTPHLLRHTAAMELLVHRALQRESTHLRFRSQSVPSDARQ
jgi:integrase